MAVEKTKAFILKVNPYRETSRLLYLFTEHHGLVHGVAKGLLRKKTGAPGLERGFLAELLLYTRPHRDLHTVAGIAMLDYYPGLRTDLLKSAVRDMAFEVILRTMSHDAPHPDVFSYLSAFLTRMEALPSRKCFPAMAWRFLFDFSALMGFGPNIDECALCGKPFAGEDGAYMLVESGVFHCNGCASPREKHGAFLPAAVLASLTDGAENTTPGSDRRIAAADARRIIRLFARYCQYHFQHYADFKSLDFMDSLLAAPVPAASATGARRGAP